MGCENNNRVGKASTLSNNSQTRFDYNYNPAQSYIYRLSQKSEPLNILQQQPQICSDLNKILQTQDETTSVTNITT